MALTHRNAVLTSSSTNPPTRVEDSASGERMEGEVQGKGGDDGKGKG